VPPLPKSFEEAARRDQSVAEELERVCGSEQFRASRRSCEFLRYIVRVTLDGRMDSLKERSIGIDLFGRDISYDPSSDATVRVRANEVRKRLNSYYASPACEVRQVRIDLPTGSYVPQFLPNTGNSVRSGVWTTTQNYSPPLLPLAAFGGGGALTSAPARVAQPVIPPIRALTLIRPALLALLVCTLLLRHQLENREEYLRFWDRLLAGRSALVLSVSPQDRASLASSLYPLVWVAGRYGVDATLQGDSLAGAKPEATSSVQVSYATTAGAPGDRRLRWGLLSGADQDRTAGSQKLLGVLLDRNAGGENRPARTAVSSAALLTILPEDAATLHVQGTDSDAIRHLLEELTMERSFPAGLVERVERLASRHALQVLVYRNSSGEWSREIFWGDA
jgi:hypothetical protein